MNPFLRLFPGLVKREQSSLAATLDELIRFGDELGVEDPARKLGVRSDRVGSGVPGNLCNPGGRVDELGGYGSRRIDRRSTLEPVREKQLRVILADSCVMVRKGRSMSRRETYVWQTFCVLWSIGGTGVGRKRKRRWRWDTSGDERPLGVFMRLGRLSPESPHRTN